MECEPPFVIYRLDISTFSEPPTTKRNTGAPWKS